MRSPFLDRLERGVVLADGAMGTQIYARGIPYERCYDELNLTDPSLVQRIHRDYIRAGAELIETNTFGANRYKLAATKTLLATIDNHTTLNFTARYHSRFPRIY